VVRVASALLYVVKLPVLEIRAGRERFFVAPASDSPLHAQEVRSLADLYNLPIYAAWQQHFACYALLECALFDHFTGEELPVESRVLAAALARRARPERLHPRKVPARFTVTLRDRLWRDRKREVRAEGLVETFFARAQLESGRARLPDGTLLLPAPRDQPRLWEFASCPELPEAPEPEGEERRGARRRGREPSEKQVGMAAFLGGGDG
jgi:uncharacterized membrane protein